MKKLLIFLMALEVLAVTTPTFAAKRSIMELPPYERAVLIIKHYETLHDTRKHWPYLGYGHRKQPGEKYFRGYKMSEQEADALLRKDLNKFIAIFSDLKPSDALLLGVLSYNIGPGAVKKKLGLSQTESRRPQYLQVPHLPLPLQRQISPWTIQASLSGVCSLVHTITLNTIYSIFQSYVGRFYYHVMIRSTISCCSVEVRRR